MVTIRFALLRCLAFSLPAAVHAEDLQSQAKSLVIGRVTSSDSTAVPLVGATVSVLAGEVSARTDSGGRFRIFSTYVGPSVVRVTRLGFRPVSFVVELRDGDSTEVDIAIEPLPQNLPTVVVLDQLSERRLDEFRDRRKRGIGTFFDEAGLRALAPDGRLATLLRHAPGANVVASRTSFAQFLVARREARPWHGAGPCYTAVVLDGLWLYRGGPGSQPFNLNSLNAKSIIAVEHYRSVSQVPASLAGLGAECGVLVLYTKY